MIQDVIRGDVAVHWAREQDHVIQRADGSFLYHLASVVDDYDFKITHVIRAEEHLSNTPRQIFIAQSLGYELPIYAHLPFVAEPGSKTKLSKRKLDKYLKNADFAALMKHGRKVADALRWMSIRTRSTRWWSISTSRWATCQRRSSTTWPCWDGPWTIRRSISAARSWSGISRWSG